jgi:predicted metal-binding membrane protein
VTSSVQPTRRVHRGRVTILSCVFLITALAWAYLIQLDRGMGMGMVMNAPWTARDVFFTFTMWSVMMVGMMSPAALPVILIYSRTRTGRAEGSGAPAVSLFALGYITVWLGFSTAAALTQFALHQASLLSPMMSVLHPRIAGAILIGAGLYQLTPLKRTCLAHCQSPLGFLMGHWRDGKIGALEMGLRHGVYCLGCCWAIMCVLFAVGVMNLAWVAVLTVFVLLEKTGPSGAIVSRIGGAIMIAAGGFVLLQ